MVGQLVAVDYLRALGGLDLTGKAAVLKTAVREHIGVRVPGPPSLQIDDCETLLVGMVS